MIPEIEQHREEIIAICEEFGVDRLFVFGSATTPSFDRASSDIDLLVIYPDGFDYGAFGSRHFELQQRLESILGRRVDLIMGRNLRNPVFIEAVRNTRQLIYAA
jgi:predicted nucleotidyltransferase